MSMRISTQQMYYTGTSNMLNRQADLYKTQNQLSTGRRILTPKDNPVDATLALLTNQSKEVNDSYMKNQEEALDQLAYVDTQLGSVVDLMSAVIERAIQGGNGSYSSQEKAAIVAELKQRFQSLVDYANGSDANGDAVFGGSRTNVTPFSVTGSSGNYSLTNSVVTYAGDDGQREMQVESSQSVPTSFSGKDVFMRVRNSAGNVTGKSVFDSVQNMIDSLDPATAVTPVPSYTSSLQDLHDSFNHLLRVRADVGAKMNQVESLNTAGADLKVQFESRLNNLTGLDYTEAITRLSQIKTQLEASQQSFVKTTQLSLFQFIS